MQAAVAIDNNVQNLVMAVEAYNESLEFFPLINIL